MYFRLFLSMDCYTRCTSANNFIFRILLEYESKLRIWLRTAAIVFAALTICCQLLKRFSLLTLS